MYSSADAGKCHGLKALRLRNVECRPVSGCEFLVFAVPAAHPNGAHGVNDEFRREVVALGEPTFADGTTIKRQTLVQDAASRRPVDGAVNAGAAQEGLIGGIDDGIHLQRRDVAQNDADAFLRVWHEVSPAVLLPETLTADTTVGDAAKDR